MDNPKAPCTACGGTGEQYVAQDIRPSMSPPESELEECEQCAGTGVQALTD